jgi:decaprenylphospho-beta-D-ribofuranose 2-oxidase
MASGGRGVLARGLGRGYGDCAQNGGGYVLDGPRMKALKGFLEREGRLGHNTHKREVPILGS